MIFNMEKMTSAFVGTCRGRIYWHETRDAAEMQAVYKRGGIFVYSKSWRLETTIFLLAKVFST